MGARNYCFTLFEQGTGLPTWSPDWQNSVRYCVYQWELCPKTNRLHMQGYVELTKVAKWPGVKKIFGYTTLHLGRRQGSPEQAREYCIKEDTRICKGEEWGEFKGNQGARSDLSSIKEKVKAGVRTRDLYEDHFATMVRHGKGIDKARLYLDPPNRWRNVHVTFIWGKGGVGKSRSVWDKEEDLFCLENDTAWWDGYDGQIALLLDDFYGQVKYSLLLRILDSYPLMRQNKGGTIWARWERIYITSNEPPEQLYQFLVDRYPFNRRIDKVIHMTSLVMPNRDRTRLAIDTNEERDPWELALGGDDGLE